MTTEILLPVLTCVRRPGLCLAFLLLFTFAPPVAWGQDRSGTSPHPLSLKSEPKKVWTEDDFAGLLKPWDLYQIEQEKKAVLDAAAPVARETPVSSDDAVLRTIDPREFNRFLKMLDADVETWQTRIRNIDVVTLGVKYQEQEEIGRRHRSCQEALERIRNEITKLSQDQTLTLDVLLLIDLNSLARNLDGLSVNLASPLTVQGAGAAHRFLGWAEEILGIDQELARHINEFQYHVLALAGVSDTALKKTQQAVDQAK